MTNPKELFCRVVADGGLDLTDNTIKIYYLKPTKTHPVPKISIEIYLEDGTETPRSFRTEHPGDLVPIILGLVRGYKKFILNSDMPVAGRNFKLIRLRKLILKEVERRE